jgi:Na+-transporting NADH:ubiquinone oxidoreductase subunit A
MATVHRVRKGYNLKLAGSPASTVVDAPHSPLCILYPSDFKGLAPKLAVKEGDRIQAGDCVFYSKSDERVRVPSPVSGEVVEIVRGEKRVLLAVKILAESQTTYRSYGADAPTALDRAAIVEKMCQSGVWTLVEMRPYGVIANPSDAPKAVFVNGMATAPHAPSVSVQLAGREAAFAAGMEVLKKLSPKTVLSVAEGDNTPAFKGLSGVEVHSFSGPHPAGNTSVHIAHVDPLNKGEVVWTLTAQDVCTVGELFLHGECRLAKVISLSGSPIKNPQHVRVVPGAQLETFLSGAVQSDNVRIVSGNVLTGVRESQSGALHFYHNQVAALPEGDQPEFLGWLLPGFGKFSLSRTFFSWLTPSKTFDLDTNMHGEERNFVMTGQYDRVFPFSIYPQHLLKAMWAGDIERMEQLGVYEVVEEDFALCEVICTSKQPLQSLVREALDTVYAEMK